MKKLLFLSLSAIGLFMYINANNKKDNLNILDTENKPTKALEKLLQHFEIKHNGSLENIVELTQKSWLRKAGSERWQMDDINTNNKSDVMQLLKDLGCVDKVMPNNNEHFDNVIVLGATANGMKQRLETVYELIKENIKFNNLVFLVGQRKRDEKEEPQNTFILNQEQTSLPLKKDWTFNGNTPATETNIAKLLCQQIEWPKVFNEKVKINFVDTPMQDNKRPTTGDTIKEWLKNTSNIGKCVFVSNNPYIGYQNAVVKTYLPENAQFITIGSAASEDKKISVYLDTIARWLYQENEYKKGKN